MEAYGKLWDSHVLKTALSFVDRWAPLLLIAFAMIAILPGLGKASLLDWDESIYAQVAREMLQSGDWINLHHGYQPYFEKPPLLMWDIALSYKLFGINEFAARLPSAIAGILLVFMTYLIGKTIYGTRTGFLAGLILLSSFGIVHHARNGTTNMPLVLFITIGIWAYLRLRGGSQKWWYLIFASFALAFMVKYWAALILPAVILIAVVADGELPKTLRSKHVWLGLLLAGLIVLPWLVLTYMENGQAFIDAVIGRNLVQRTLTPLDGHSGTTLYYLDLMRVHFSPWFFLIPFALAQNLKDVVKQQGASKVLLCVIIVTLGLYTFVVNTKQDNYILPIFPALAILIAYLFELSASHSRPSNFIYLVSAALCAAFVAQKTILILCIFIGVALFILIKAQAFSREPLFRITTSLIFVVFFMIGTLDYAQGNNRLATWSVYQLPDSPVSQIAALAREHNPSIDDPLLGYFPPDAGLEPEAAVAGPAATFYSNRRVIVAESWDGLVEVMRKQGAGEMLIAEKYLQLLPADFEVSVVEHVQPLVYATFCHK